MNIMSVVEDSEGRTFLGCGRVSDVWLVVRVIFLVGDATPIWGCSAGKMLTNSLEFCELKMI